MSLQDESEGLVCIGVLGCGKHSNSQHGPALRHYKSMHSETVELVAVCDLDADRAAAYAREFGFRRAYSDFREMLSTETLDGLVVVSAIEATRAIVGELLPFGVPLLVEKPPGKNSREGRELVEIARQCGTPAMVSMNRRFNPAVVMAAEWMAENAPEDRARQVIARMLRSERREPEFIVATGIHLVDTALSFLGRPRTVSSARWRGEDGGENCAATISTSCKDRALVVMAPNSGRTAETVEICGAGYSIRVDVTTCGMAVWQEDEVSHRWQAPEDMPGYVKGGSLGEVKAFVGAIMGKRNLAPDLETALVSVEVSEAIESGGERSFEAQPI